MFVRCAVFAVTVARPVHGSTLIAAISVIALATASPVPTFRLKNAASVGMQMPAIGLGTGGYNDDKSVGYNGYPECWSEDTGCGAFVERAVTQWLKLGGRRLDCSNSYHNQAAVGRAIIESKVPREELFILQKVGPSLPLGYQDALDQFEQIKSDMQVDYVDLLLIHWPSQNPSQGNVKSNEKGSSDRFCNNIAYDAYKCRLSTWKALVEIWRSGGARAIGVSNYDVSHLTEIVEAGLPLPSVNQCAFHMYNHQDNLRRFCHEHQILFNAYSPFGVPDWHKFPHGVPMMLHHPTVEAIAETHQRTAAQVILQWHFSLGIPSNPRSMNSTHMLENIGSFDFTLSAHEVGLLSAIPELSCDRDPWYECVEAPSLLAHGRLLSNARTKASALHQLPRLNDLQ